MEVLELIGQGYALIKDLKAAVQTYEWFKEKLKGKQTQSFVRVSNCADLYQKFFEADTITFGSRVEITCYISPYGFTYRPIFNETIRICRSTPESYRGVKPEARFDLSRMNNISIPKKIRVKTDFTFDHIHPPVQSLPPIGDGSQQSKIGFAFSSNFKRLLIDGAVHRTMGKFDLDPACAHIPVILDPSFAFNRWGHLRAEVCPSPAEFDNIVKSRINLTLNSSFFQPDHPEKKLFLLKALEFEPIDHHLPSNELPMFLETRVTPEVNCESWIPLLSKAMEQINILGISDKDKLHVSLTTENDVSVLICKGAICFYKISKTTRQSFRRDSRVLFDTYKRLRRTLDRLVKDQLGSELKWYITAATDFGHTNYIESFEHLPLFYDDDITNLEDLGTTKEWLSKFRR
jgi:hypothetical protein